MDSQKRCWKIAIGYAVLLFFLQLVFVPVTYEILILVLVVWTVIFGEMSHIVINSLRGLVVGVLCVCYVKMVSKNKTYHVKVKWACFIALCILYIPIISYTMYSNYNRRGSLFYSDWFFGDIALSCIIILATYLVYCFLEAVYKIIKPAKKDSFEENGSICKEKTVSTHTEMEGLSRELSDLNKD